MSNLSQKSRSTNPDVALPRVADHIALDLLNTQPNEEAGRPEQIPDGQTLVNWMREAGLLQDEPWLHEQPRQRYGAGLALSGTMDDLAAEARSLRWQFQAFVVRHAGKKLSTLEQSELSWLNQVLERERAFRQAVAKDGVGGLRWTEWIHTSPEEALLPVLAREMCDLMCTADFRRVRRCEASGCLLWFLDTTKSGRRRWCSMAVCGNRAKVTAFRHRQSAEADAAM